ncbi:DNA-binding response regulator [Paenibacillus sp. BIHB 4019]|uniref:DNA-binding response regulator n=1 Tax=Paenibacillus sp. BIHB 4019 TaxID=1870819 RepID=A0A1B2DS47_9BACL|nr:response regulator transcription factor [Paenibacillus sp. BIHB 4019]ANY70520.1 DNA-binding response regulator [Paenibacillus sp. BIHB 4019]
MKIKLLLVDDHQIVLKGIAFFLNLQPDFEIVGEAANGKEAVEKAAELQPDMILMDLQMPVMDGIEASRIIAEQHPAIKVLVLTSFSDRGHIVPALQTGAIGYMLKDVAPDQLAEAIRSAYKGNIQLHPDISGVLIGGGTPAGRFERTEDRLLHPPLPLQSEPDSTRVKSDQLAFTSLTPREIEVLRQLMKGKSNKEIARALVVAEKTVKTHVSSILSKLDVTDRTQAALRGIHYLGPES